MVQKPKDEDLKRSPLGDDLVARFCNHCSWVYRVWSTFRIVFDDNPNVAEFDECHFASHLQMIADVNRDYLALQICALHDPALQLGRENFNVTRIAEDARWDETTRAQLGHLKEKMEGFAEHLRPARNRIVAHLDLRTFSANGVLGAFPADADKTYFDNLQRFVDLVHGAAIGGGWPLYDAMDCNDAEGFANAIVQHVRDRCARGESLKRSASTNA